MTAQLDPTSSATLEQWQSDAASVLRKAGREVEPDAVAAALSRCTIEGLTVPALAIGDAPDHGMPGAAPFVRGSALLTDGWDIRAAVHETEPTRAAAVALEELSGGATSLWLTVGAAGISVDALPDVLAGVYLDLAPVVFTTSPGTALETARALATIARDRGVTLHPGTNLGVDGLALAPNDIREIVRIARDLGIRAFTVDANLAHEGGAGDAAELGWSLAAGVAVLRALEQAGIDVREALPLLEFRFAATDDQFPTIAKFRAARLLWDRVAEVSGGGDDRGGQHQHAVTSWPMTSRYDSYTNLLRTTVAAFAAGVGGANAVTVRPFDQALGIPEMLGRRMARNISHLLLGESHVAATADPAGGSCAVEQLTRDLATAGWAEFQVIEAAGGASAALADGSVQARWQATAVARSAHINSRQQPLTGVSEFPQLAEILPLRRPSASTGPRWADRYEELRDDPTPTPVFLATLGPVAAHTARATFAVNAFAAGGVTTESSGPTADVTAVLAAYDGQPVVALAGSDGSYADWAAELVPALRAAGARRILLAGRPAPEIADLVDDFVAMGVDLAAFLDRTRAALAAAPTAGAEK